MGALRFVSLAVGAVGGPICKAQGDPTPSGEGRNCAYSPPLNHKVFILIVVSPN